MGYGMVFIDILNEVIASSAIGTLTGTTSGRRHWCVVRSNAVVPSFLVVESLFLLFSNHECCELAVNVVLEGSRRLGG